MDASQVPFEPYGGRGLLIVGVTWAEASLAIILMALRTYSNGFILNSFRWDYWWATVTLVGCFQI